MKNKSIKTLAMIGTLIASIISTNVNAADLDFKNLKSASGFPLEYGVEYYIFDKEKQNDRGGLTFEPYNNFDNLYYSDSTSALGTTMIIEGKPSYTQVTSKDKVTMRATDSTWDYERSWGIRNYLVSSFKKDMILYSKPDPLNIVGSKDNSIGFSSIDADFNGIGFLWKMRVLVSDYGARNKLWLYSHNGIIMGSQLPSDLDPYYKQVKTPMKFYEKSYTESYKSMIAHPESIVYTVSSKYADASVRYLLTVNGKVISELYNGKAYKASKEKVGENTKVTTSYKVSKGDRIKVEVATGSPESNNFAILQTLADYILG